MVDFDWDEFLDLAEEMVRRRGDPAAERSAVSRAYYAVFHEASQYVNRRGERLTFTGDDHILVWDWFLQPGLDPRPDGSGTPAMPSGERGARRTTIRRRCRTDRSTRKGWCDWPDVS